MPKMSYVHKGLDGNAGKLIIFCLFSFFAVPPDEPVIYDSDGMRLLDVTSPVAEGESLTLTCETSGGEYIPVFITTHA